MQHIRGIHHVAVSVPDIQLARRFYIDLLGAREVSQAEWPEGTAYINEIVGLPDCSGRQFIARLDGAKKVGFLATYGRDYFGNIFELIEINSASAIAPL